MDRRSPAARLREMLPGCAFSEQLFWLEETDSTNDEIKRLSRRGLAAPIAVFADAQTNGRGRLGRSFLSEKNKGLYFSVLLSPRCAPEELCTLTAWSAVAVCQALKNVCGLDADIKWPNDIVINGKKLCGILTELLNDKNGAVKGVIIGIGINVSQTAADFGSELSDKALSLSQLTAPVPGRLELAAACLASLEKMSVAFPGGRADYLSAYRARCLTAGRAVRLATSEGERLGVAECVEDDFTLRVRLDNGELRRVSSGEVSVRGIYGYI